MKKLRISLSVLGFVLAIGASFAFRTPETQPYQFISGAHPSCSAVTASCPGGSNTCTVSSINLYDSPDAQFSCGNLLKMQ